MKVEKVTLPLMAALFLIGTGNSLALAQGRASALDPYAMYQAPTTAQRQAQIANKKKKKFKVPTLRAKNESPAELAPPPVAKVAPPKPASVIISANSPKLDDEPKKEVRAKAPVTANASSGDDGGFLDGIKQSTSGIAKSTKALGSGMVNGSKSVGSKIASGFKSAGEKVGDGMKSTTEKVKEGGSGMGEKVAGVGGKVADGFKSAGGALAALPKKVGASGEGAKKLAAAPVAGFAAIGHGMNKLNPFHKDAPAPVAVAQKGEKGAAKTELAGAPKPAQNLVPEKKDAELANSETESEVNAEKVAEAGGDKPAAEAVSKTPEKKEAVKPQVAQKEEGGGLMKKLASAPLSATKAGLGKTKSGTKAGVGMLSSGMNKLNPFHREKSEPLPRATAAKPPVEAKPAEAPKPEDAATAAETTAEKPIDATSPVTTPTPESQPKIGERIEIPGEDGPAKDGEGATTPKESVAGDADAVTTH